MRIASICVQEEGFYDAQHFTMLLEILSPDIKTKEDLVKAVNAACTDFVKPCLQQAPDNKKRKLPCIIQKRKRGSQPLPHLLPHRRKITPG